MTEAGKTIKISSKVQHGGYLDGNMYKSGSFKVCDKGRMGIIHSLGVLNWEIYDCISSKHVTDEVIITEEQMKHIRERHPESYTDTMNYIREILDDPDWIFRDKRPNTGLVAKRIKNNEESSLLVLKIITAGDKKNFKNSVITSWKVSQKRMNNYLRNKEVIYKKE